MAENDKIKNINNVSESNDVKELFSKVFYMSPLSINNVCSLIINLDSRFDKFYKSMILLHESDNNYELPHVNLLFQYEIINKLDYFHKNYQYNNEYFYSKDELKKEDKYHILFNYKKHNGGSNFKETIFTSYFDTIYDKMDAVYDEENDKIINVITQTDCFIDNKWQKIIFNFHKENFLNWRNGLHFDELLIESEENFQSLSCGIQQDLSNFYFKKYANMFAEYFSHVQHFLNIHCLNFATEKKIRIANDFLQLFDKGYPVVLEGKLREIYIKYYHLMKTKVNTLENIDELNKFYEKNFVS